MEKTLVERIGLFTLAWNLLLHNQSRSHARAVITTSPRKVTV